MQPRVNVITLGTKNLERLRKFYEQGLGWKASSTSNEHFVAFQLGGIILCLFPEALLADDAMTTISSEQGFRGITLAHNVANKGEVDVILKQAVSAGAKLQKAAQDVFWGGYSGYFSDPDGHLWEVAWNPHWTLTIDGVLKLPE
jgi:uncharacterized glyoxalase superfamily protein PhnB